MMNEIIRDGGIKSRKLWFSIFAIAVIFVGAILAAHWAAMISVYSTMVGGVLGVVGAYLTGNVAQKWIGVKALPDPSKSDPTDDEPASK